MTFINEFCMKEKLATTDFASVKRCERFNAQTSEIESFCCKRLRKHTLTRKREFVRGADGRVVLRSRLLATLREAAVLQTLEHPRCLKLVAFLDSDENSDEGKLYIITTFYECGALMHLQLSTQRQLSRLNSHTHTPPTHTHSPPPHTHSPPPHTHSPPTHTASIPTPHSQAIHPPHAQTLQQTHAVPLPQAQTHAHTSPLEVGAPADKMQFKFVPKLLGLSCFPENLAKCFVKDAAEGLSYLHDALGICHRDVKVDNLLLGADGRVGLGDFGSAEPFDLEGNVRGTQGTYMFMSPECLAPQSSECTYRGHDARAADVWALGVCTYIMLFGAVPFYSPSFEGLFTAITEGRVCIPSGHDLSELAIDFLTKIFDPEVQKRMTLKEVIAHGWVDSADFGVSAQYAEKILEQERQGKER